MKTLILLGLTTCLLQVSHALPAGLFAISESADSEAWSSEWSEPEAWSSEWSESVLWSSESSDWSSAELAEWADSPQIQAFQRTIHESTRDFTSQSLERFLDLLRNIRGLLAADLATLAEAAARGSLNIVVLQLEAVEASVEFLQEHSAVLEQSVAAEREGQRTSILANWRNWADRVLQNVQEVTQDNQEQTARAQRLVEALVEGYTEYLDTCDDERQVRLYFQGERTQGIIENYSDVVTRLNAQARNGCLAPLNQTDQCRLSVCETQNRLKFAPRTFGNLFKSLVAIYKDQSCYVRALREFEREKFLAVQAINREIIDGDQADEESEESSGESSEQDSAASSEKGDSEASSDEADSGSSSAEESSDAASSDSDSSDSDSDSSDSDGDSWSNENDWELEDTESLEDGIYFQEDAYNFCNDEHIELFLQLKNTPVHFVAAVENP